MTDASKPFGEATDADYVRLTTFRRDGTPVSSPVWAVFDEGRLHVWTESGTWKAKRIRHDPHVIVQACDFRGRKLSGEPVDATAGLLDGPGTQRVRRMVNKKYGILAKVITWFRTWRNGEDGTVGIEIRPLTAES
ncbi:PPOX class F420-dependent oxidoreductase [Gordonia rhizosphera]|uniref:Pyridoxamine 5'-phosphate oxidase N-terminal domain-containing protein n=1 Tax=Gordonia rhizosphera NBRC 16068 TaxID=1108045 RepID=K6WG73_9ACTN|nr:PPOX class F420-dependent oxidoreductase [Gordonia rhizosphera]GAB91167.1 hypothetical protein GORHZ_125_00500 [Gordonia rhizosphera NBRC 16068]